jgi:hypothetical protein
MEASPLSATKPMTESVAEPKVAVAESTAPESEFMASESTAEPKVAVVKSTAVEPEAPAEAASAKAGQVNVGPTSAVT